MDAIPVHAKKLDDSIRKILNICDVSHIDALKIVIHAFGIFNLFLKETNSYGNFIDFLEHNDLLFDYEYAHNLYKAVQDEILEEEWYET